MRNPNQMIKRVQLVPKSHMLAGFAISAIKWDKLATPDFKTTT